MDHDPARVDAPLPERPISTGAFMATLAQIATVAAGGLTTIVVARLVGPVDTGSFNVALSALTLLLVMSTLGIEVAISYQVGRGDWPAAEALRQTQVGAFAVGVVATATGLGLGALGADTVFQGVGFPVLALTLCAIPFGLSALYGSYVAVALNRYEVHALINAAQGVVMLALVCGLVPPFGITGAAAAVLLSRVLTSAGVLVWGRRALPGRGIDWWAGTRRALGRASRFGIKANVSNVLQQLSYRADLFLLNAVVGGAVVGRYAIALAVTTPGLVLPRALAAVVLPRLSLLTRPETQGRLHGTTVRTVRHSILLAGFAVALMSVGLLAVPLIYGSDFAGAVSLGFILVPGVAIMGVGVLLAAAVVSRGSPQYSLYNALIVTPPTLALYAVLVPTLGAPGAALASTVSYAATGVVWLLFFRRVTSISISAELLPGRAELRDYTRLARRARVRLGRPRSADVTDPPPT